MIIYKCILTGDEMFSDVYKVIESENGMMYEVEGKLTSRKPGEFDDSLIGANASAEDDGEVVESTTISGVDIVLNHSLQPSPFTKDSYKSYIKDYMKAIKEKLSESNPGRVNPFMKGAQDEVKKILSNFKDYEFFSGESMNPEGIVGILDYREDGLTPFMLFFKDGLEIEKC